MFDFFEELWDWGGEVVGESFKWLGENPEVAAGLASGLGKGAVAYLAAQEKSKSDRELEELRQRRTDNRHYAQYGGIGGYVKNLTADGGTLTQGLLANQMGGQSMALRDSSGNLVGLSRGGSLNGAGVSNNVGGSGNGNGRGSFFGRDLSPGPSQAENRAAALAKNNAIKNEADKMAELNLINEAAKASEAQKRKASEAKRLKAQADKVRSEGIINRRKSVAAENAAIEAESKRMLTEGSKITDRINQNNADQSQAANTTIANTVSENPIGVMPSTAVTTPYQGQVYYDSKGNEHNSQVAANNSDQNFSELELQADITKIQENNERRGINKEDVFGNVFDEITTSSISKRDADAYMRGGLDTNDDRNTTVVNGVQVDDISTQSTNNKDTQVGSSNGVPVDDISTNYIDLSQFKDLGYETEQEAYQAYQDLSPEAKQVFDALRNPGMGRKILEGIAGGLFPPIKIAGLLSRYVGKSGSLKDQFNRAEQTVITAQNNRDNQNNSSGNDNSNDGGSADTVVLPEDTKDSTSNYEGISAYTDIFGKYKF